MGGGMKMAQIRINISNLSDGVHEYIFDVDPLSIGLDDRFKGTIKVEATLQKNMNQYYLKSALHFNCICECDRCLNQFSMKIDKQYSIVYIKDAEGSAFRDEAEEMQFLSSDANYIDLDDDIRQYALLTIPAKLLCKEDCLGLCPECGANRNVIQCDCDKKTMDPRWDKLKKLTFN